ncbi:MAG TPA: hypothetical protein DEG17_20005 [Cyanobacteria bacterium UBA11149]|nr:hypothetical protein [Cyanobacteria bacterium UBA11366]HBK66013.1 hypothetical protein [Cyanobacteria bacterium UBA11166]HBR76924.1 hypothetical protein [Cyanobacteria bacterium UBA11159]HBS68313.1 hypothetical protein [Cyanobacteria bacterium UBA11153]HBW91082.1 hypothetical protein [Cyanobacteria bacterium UBA11149]HCA94735.1 hypothetical protein [Cyanobacteria bacterium UBA9226]
MTRESGLGYQDFSIHNRQSLKRLARAIAMSDGEFSLILVCCKGSPQPLPLQIVNELRGLSSIPIEGIILNSQIDTLFGTILSAIDEPPPPALIIFGLESLVAIDSILSAANLVRDEFRKQFPFPLVLWIDDEILQKLIRLAPDLKSWATNPIRLEIRENQAAECELAAIVV